jgi:hypothetical protein
MRQLVLLMDAKRDMALQDHAVMVGQVRAAETEVTECVETAASARVAWRDYLSGHAPHPLLIAGAAHATQTSLETVRQSEERLTARENEAELSRLALAEALARASSSAKQCRLQQRRRDLRTAERTLAAQEDRLAMKRHTP